MGIINKLYIALYVKTSSSRYISYLRKKGIKIGIECKFRGPSSSTVDLTRPSLVSIGDYVDMNLNFTILTHDYATSVFLRKYNDFLNSSGKVLIGNNVYFGKNCTVLKGVTIGDNCIIGASSLVISSIPSNSVAAGVPAKVLGSVDNYYSKRKSAGLEEAFEYARSIVESYGRMPIAADFKEEFIYFVSGYEVDKYPEIPIRFQLMEAFDHWKENHIAPYKSLDSFLKAAGL